MTETNLANDRLVGIGPLLATEVIAAARGLMASNLGFHEGRQEWFCRRCRPEKDAGLHATRCPVYRLHAAIDRLEEHTLLAEAR